MICTYNGHAHHTGGEDRPSTHVGHKNPRDSSTDDEHRVEDHVEGEGERSANAGLLQELDTLADERLTTENCKLLARAVFRG